MKKLPIIGAALIAIVALTACGGPPPAYQSCVHHGGVKFIGKDATNSQAPVACNDGYVFKLDM